MQFPSYLNWRKLSISVFPKLNPIDLFVLGSYYFFLLTFFLSLLGLFRKEFIILGLGVGFLFLLVFWKKIELSKRCLYFFILIPVLFTGTLLIKGSFEGDGIDYWLPWAREIVWQERMPDFLFNTAVWLTGRMPLAPLFHAGLFSLFGFDHWVIAVLPFFFASVIVFLVYQWLLEKGVKKSYLIFGILFILTNPLFLQYIGEPTQEPFVLFFFTTFFYYWEKFQKTKNQFHLLLLFLSLVLAVVSKETGFILFLPLGWLLIKNRRLIEKPYLYLFLTFPLLLWLLRNYLIYDNPVFPLLNEIFKGRYYNLISVSEQIAQSFFSPSQILASLLWWFLPLGVMAFYGFCKKGRVGYILLFFIFLLLIIVLTPDLNNYIRFLMPFLAVFVVYALMGLEEIKSRIYLSLIFFFNFWGLFFTKLSLSESQFLSPIEKTLDGFRALSQLIYDYRLGAALVLAIFFYFLISRHNQAAKYLIALSVSVYLVKTQTFSLGSWLNIWLPILSLIFIVLAWGLAIKLKEETLHKLVVFCMVILLLLNGWGLAVVYFVVHKSFTFPNLVEAYGVLPAVAQEIEKLEGQNRDFYLYAASDSYFIWYHNFKIVIPRLPAFHIITNLEYRDDLSPSEIHSLFQKSKIKYIVNGYSIRFQLTPFFDKIASRQDLFEPIFQEEGASLWQVR